MVDASEYKKGRSRAKTLIELLEGGTIPWRTSWSSVRPKRQREKKPVLVPVLRLGLPISISSAKTYQGVNVLILWGAALKPIPLK